MSGPMDIAEIGWQRAGSAGSASGNYNSFKMYLSYSNASELTNTYADNYTPGTRTLVYQTGSQVMSAGADEWMNIALDTPFAYNGNDNLIVEFEWVGGSNMFYTYMWDTGTNRGLMNKNSVTAPTGTLYTKMSELMFEEDTAALEAVTFAAIKMIGNY